MLKKCASVVCAAVVLASAAAHAAVVRATYEFDHTFAAIEPGAPAAVQVDPLGSSTFSSDVVFGESRAVYNFAGDATPASQSGFTVNTTGLISPDSYSVDMVFKFVSRPTGWRRIIDVQNRASDAGFYVDPGNNLQVYTANGTSAGWTNDVYHHVVLTVDGTAVSAYLDGVSQFTTTTSVMGLDSDPANNPDRLMGFFLDNTVGGGQSEWSGGSIALARLWDGVLTPAEAQELATNPFVPEPGSASLLGVAGLGLIRRGRRV